MKRFFVALAIILSIKGFSQQTRDTVLSRCPVFILDTVSGNNFFIEGRPCTLKVYKVRGNLNVQVEQKDQFFTIFFHIGKLKNGKYGIATGSNARGEVAVKYSFKSGDQASYIDVVKGYVDCRFDKEKKMWRLKTDGLIANMVERGVSYYKAKAELWIK
jgi:hypothetical protein